MQPQGLKKATVAPLVAIDKHLTYTIPDSFTVAIGNLVQVPLRQSQVPGIILDLEGQSTQHKLKPITKVLSKEPFLTPSLLKMADWMTRYYGCSLNLALKAMIPAGLYKISPLQKRKQVSLIKLLTLEERQKLKKSSPRQAACYEYLHRIGTLEEKHSTISLMDLPTQFRPGLVSLIKKGIVKLKILTLPKTYAQPQWSTAVATFMESLKFDPATTSLPFPLQEAIQRQYFSTSILQCSQRPALMKAYLQAIKITLDQGKNVLWLVPEHFWLNTIMSILYRTFPSLCVEVAGFHGELSEGYKNQCWTLLAKNKIRIFVGTRSALFAPLSNLGLIIVDQEQSDFYKNPETPRYHTRDMAIYRAKLESAVCLLGASIPSLESFYNSRHKQFPLYILPARKTRLIKTRIVDLNQEKGNLCSSMLLDRIQYCLSKREQILLLLNRRGYSPKIFCTHCHQIVRCPQCQNFLNFYKKDALSRCSWCGFQEVFRKTCAHCKENNLKPYGFGTQRIEEKLKIYFPQAKIGRFDGDSIYSEALKDFTEGKIDLLIGTQIVLKCIDSPKLTLIGILNADLQLQYPDFRAKEKTFQQLSQVLNQAQESFTVREIVLQTYFPQNPMLREVIEGRWENFLATENQERALLGYPPHCTLFQILFKGSPLESLTKTIQQWLHCLNKTSFTVIQGPALAPLARKKDAFRMHVWLLTNKPLQSMAILKKSLNVLHSRINYSIDVNPTDWA